MKTRSRRLLPALFAVACALSAPGLCAQSARDLPRKEISESIAAGFGRLQPLVDAKDHAGALALVERLLGSAAPASYDAYVLSQIQAQLLLAQNRLAEAIAPLERAHALAEGNANFLDVPAHLERINLLAQLHYQVGAEQKTPEAQRAGYEQARVWLGRWLERAPRATPELRLFASSLLYQMATLGSTPDAALLREALVHAEEALLLSPRPSNQLRLLLVACHLQLGEHARAAEQLELLAERDPANAATWSQLQSLYLSAAADAEDPAVAREQNLRALHVLDRAQARGHLSSPKDNYTRVAILFNLGQFTRAAALLEGGLADGSIDDSRRNWELLASAYQQTNQPALAADAMARAVARFPEDGSLEFSLAQFLHGTGRLDDAYARGRSALAKPGLEKPGQANLYLAFLAYELQRYDEAARWIAAARDAGGVPASSVDPLARAINEAIARREAVRGS